MPVQLYDVKTGAPTQKDAASAQQGVLDGSYAPRPEELVHVVLADGRKGTVPGHELAENLSRGATILDPEVEHQKQLHEEQSGFAGGVGAAVGGAFNGATGGLGLGLVRRGIGALSPSAGKSFQDTVQAQREEHPIATVVGEVAGAAGTAYAAHKAPALRFAPAAGIDALGGAVGRGVGAALGAGEGLAASAGRAAAVSAARAATEGALYAAGTHVGEDMLGDVPTAADKLFIATAKGGAFGLGLGGLLGGAGSLVRGMRGAASKGGGALVSEAATEAATLAEQRLAAAEAAHADATSKLVPQAPAPPAGVEGMSPRALEEMQLRFTEDPATAARRAAMEVEHAATGKEVLAAQQASEEAQHLARLGDEIRQSDPHKLVDRLTFQATGADAATTKRINKFPGGIDRVGATMRRLGILDVAEGQGAIKATLGSLSENTPEKMLERTTSKLSELVDEMQGIGGTKASATLGELLAPLDAQIKKLGEVSTSVPVARQLMAQRQMLLGTPKFQHLLDVDGNLIPGALREPVSLSDIIAERRGVGRKAYAVGDVHASIIKESNAALYAAWDELEQKALEGVQGGLGGKFKSVKTDITDLINAEKALEGKVARATSARAFGVLPHMAGMAGASIGGAILPVGGHLIGHALGAMASKSIMDRGNAAAAVALTKIADIGALKHLLGTVDKQVAGAARGLTRAAESKTPKVRVVGGSATPKEDRRPPLAERYRGITKQLDALENAASPVHERAMAATQDLAQHAPNVAQAFAVSMARAAAYLSSKRPQPLLPMSPYSAREPSVPVADKLSFIRTWTAATDPMGILWRFEHHGQVTPEDADALKELAPTVYQELHTAVMSEVATSRAAGKTMPYKRRQAIGMLFPDISAEPSLDPQLYKLLQGNVLQEPPPQPPSKGGKQNAPRRPVKLPDSTSPLDRLMQSGAGRK